uniref:Uncharacterized protein n=1 Tax=Trichogramma kaykai TaxID=54128 RepID=A0ABD2VXB4_9HYME
MSRSSLGTPVHQELKPPRSVSAVHPCTYAGSLRHAKKKQQRSVEGSTVALWWQAAEVISKPFRISKIRGIWAVHDVYNWTRGNRALYVCGISLQRNKDFVIINQFLCVSTSVKDEHRRNRTREFKSVHAIENTFVRALRVRSWRTIRASIVCASYHEMRFGKEERSRPTDLVKHLLVVLVRFYRLICRSD